MLRSAMIQSMKIDTPTVWPGIVIIMPTVATASTSQP